MQPGSAWRSWVVPSLALLAAVAAPGLWAGLRAWRMARAAHVELPMGPDPDLWGEAALQARDGRPLDVPPLYPVLCDALSGGASLVDGALRANAVALALAVVLAGLTAALLCRRPLIAVTAALAAAAAVNAGLDWGGVAFYMQPDSVAFASLAAVACAGALLARWDRWWSALVFGGAVGIALGAREHGLVVAVASLPIPLLVARGAVRRRVGLLACALLGFQLIGGVATGHPTCSVLYHHYHWHGTITKARVAMGHSTEMATSGAGPETDLPREMGPAPVPDSPLELVATASARSLAVGRALLPLLGLGVLGLLSLAVLGRWRDIFGVGVALLPLAATVVVWTEWRHLFIPSAAALAVGAGGVGALLERSVPRLGAALLVSVSAWFFVESGPIQVEAAKVRLRTIWQAQQFERDLILATHHIVENSDESDVIIGPTRVAVVAGLPRFHVTHAEISQSAVPAWPDALWRAWLISAKGVGDAWEAQFRSGPVVVYRLPRPEGVSAPCLTGQTEGLVVVEGRGQGRRPAPPPHPKCYSSAPPEATQEPEGILAVDEGAHGTPTTSPRPGSP